MSSFRALLFDPFHLVMLTVIGGSLVAGYVTAFVVGVLGVSRTPMVLPLPVAEAMVVLAVVPIVAVLVWMILLIRIDCNVLWR